ncbi:MAG: hypothetical protein DHS20C21_20790 [Gemmatimonadota bacterium]|nr:MAG: hypothetical protein DHS20C21_20790 [Gemmatimonadota bacterium]
MSESIQPGSTPHPSELRPLLETDRRKTVEFLGRKQEENIYLLARIASDGVVNEESVAHGHFYGHFVEDVLTGVAFFGHRKGFVLAGDDQEFLRAAARLAQGPEADWIILVAPRVAADGFLSHYRWLGRSTHLNRLQDFYTVRAETLPRLAGAVRPAELRDLEAVVEMSEQMLMEDFDLGPGSLSRDGIRESMRHKIREGRTWLAEMDGRTVFKVDVSAQFNGGAQIEGVFTRPAVRGQGVASRSVAALAQELLTTSAFVTLHVDQHNLPAKRAYEKAGFCRTGEFRLVLLQTP